MRKILSVLLICGFSLALLSGCGGKSGQDETTSSIDFSQYLNSPGFYACTDIAWYICQDMQLYVQDTELKTPLQPLCAKPDCTHVDRDSCSSYLPIGAYGVFAWNNTLVYPSTPINGSEIQLCQMGLDGQDRKVLTTLFPDGNDSSYVANCSCGWLTMNMTEYTVNGDVNTLYLYSLADPTAEPAVLFSNAEQVETAQGDTSQIPRSYVMHMGEEWVFYNLEFGPSGARTNSLYGYEIATGETRLLVEDDFFIGGDLSPVGDTLYWYDTDGSTYGRLNQIDLNTGETTLVRDIPITEDVWGNMDDKYLYVSCGSAANPAELVIYDFQGNELQRLSCQELGMSIGYVCSNGSKAVFRRYDLGAMMPVCWVDKDKLAQGKAEFHMIETEP